MGYRNEDIAWDDTQTSPDEIAWDSPTPSLAPSVAQELRALSRGKAEEPVEYDTGRFKDLRYLPQDIASLGLEAAERTVKGVDIGFRRMVTSAAELAGSGLWAPDLTRRHEDYIKQQAEKLTEEESHLPPGERMASRAASGLAQMAPQVALDTALAGLAPEAAIAKLFGPSIGKIWGSAPAWARGMAMRSAVEAYTTAENPVQGMAAATEAVAHSLAMGKAFHLPQDLAASRAAKGIATSKKALAYQTMGAGVGIGLADAEIAAIKQGQALPSAEDAVVTTAMMAVPGLATIAEARNRPGVAVAPKRPPEPPKPPEEAGPPSPPPPEPPKPAETDGARKFDELMGVKREPEPEGDPFMAGLEGDLVRPEASQGASPPPAAPKRRMGKKAPQAPEGATEAPTQPITPAPPVSPKGDGKAKPSKVFYEGFKPEPDRARAMADELAGAPGKPQRKFQAVAGVLDAEGRPVEGTGELQVWAENVPEGGDASEVQRREEMLATGHRFAPTLPEWARGVKKSARDAVLAKVQAGEPLSKKQTETWRLMTEGQAKETLDAMESFARGLRRDPQVGKEAGEVLDLLSIAKATLSVKDVNRATRAAMALENKRPARADLMADVGVLRPDMATKREDAAPWGTEEGLFGPVPKAAPGAEPRGQASTAKNAPLFEPPSPLFDANEEPPFRNAAAPSEKSIFDITEREPGEIIQALQEGRDAVVVYKYEKKFGKKAEPPPVPDPTFDLEAFTSAWRQRLRDVHEAVFTIANLPGDIPAEQWAKWGKDPEQFRGAQALAGVSKDGVPVFVLFKGNIVNAEEAIKVMLHEPAHIFPKMILGDARFDAFRDGIWKRAQNDNKLLLQLREYAETTQLDLSTQDGQRRAAGELIAYWAETNKEPKFMQQVVAAVRQWLRDNWGESFRPEWLDKISDNDIRALIAKSARFERGEKTGPRVPPAGPEVEIEGARTTAYHGTRGPPFDRFRKEFIGTGEGTDVPELIGEYGYGHYFAGEEWRAKEHAKYLPATKGVRRIYRASLVPGKEPGREAWLDWDEPVTKEAEGAIGAQLQRETGRSLTEGREEALALVREAGKWVPGKEWQEISPADLGRAGAPPEVINAWWDALGDNALAPLRPQTGGSLYRHLERLFGGGMEASQFLVRAGFDGTRYEATDHKGRGYNYVVFEDKDIEIESVEGFRNSKKKLEQGVLEGFSDPADREAVEAIGEASGVPVDAVVHMLASMKAPPFKLEWLRPENRARDMGPTLPVNLKIFDKSVSDGIQQGLHQMADLFGAPFHYWRRDKGVRLIVDAIRQGNWRREPFERDAQQLGEALWKVGAWGPDVAEAWGMVAGDKRHPEGNADYYMKTFNNLSREKADAMVALDNIGKMQYDSHVNGIEEDCYRGVRAATKTDADAWQFARTLRQMPLDTTTKGWIDFILPYKGENSKAVESRPLGQFATKRTAELYKARKETHSGPHSMLFITKAVDAGTGKPVFVVNEYTDKLLNWAVLTRARIEPLLHRIPHYFSQVRSGPLAVTVKDTETGRMLIHSQFDTQAEVDAVRAWAKENYPDAEITSGRVQEMQQALRNTKEIQNLDPIMDRLNLSSLEKEMMREAAMQYTWEWGYGSHNLPRKGGPKGVPGFSLDAPKIVWDSISAHAGMLAKKEAIYQIHAAMDSPAVDLPKDSYKAEWVRDYINHNLTTQPQNAALSMAKRATFYWLLGGKLSQFFLQGSQMFTTGIPQLSATIKEIGAKASSHKEVLNAARDIYRKHRLSAEESEALAWMDSTGELNSQQELHYAGATQFPGVAAIRKAGRMTGKVLSAPFAIPDRETRRILALAAYRVHRKAGYPPEAAQKGALDVTTAMFLSGKVAAPRIGRGPVGEMAMFLKRFTYEQATWYLDQMLAATDKAGGPAARSGARIALAQSTAYMAVFGGLAGTVFGKSLDWAMEKVFGIGLDEALRLGSKRVFGKKYGRRVGTMLARGVPAALGYDMSESIAMRIFAPNARWDDPAQVAKNMADLVLGPTVMSWLTQAYRASGSLKYNEKLRALEDISPNFLKGPLEAVRKMEGMEKRGGADVRRYNPETGEMEQAKYTLGEAIVRGIGGRPPGDVAAQHAEEARKESIADFKDRIEEALIEKNPDEQAAIRADIRAWNKKAKEAEVQPIDGDKIFAEVGDLVDKRIEKRRPK